MSWVILNTKYDIFINNVGYIANRGPMITSPTDVTAIMAHEIITLFFLFYKYSIQEA